MPVVDHDNMINEYDPDEIVDESAYDKDYRLPDTRERDSDHELTTDAYTDSDESDDSDSDGERNDIGHHGAYDDEAEEQDEPGANLTVAEPAAEAPEQVGKNTQRGRSAHRKRSEHQERSARKKRSARRETQSLRQK